ncbi:alkaline phosphatase [Aquisphaera insulae]|uniref:alkaline phosphatase n=1 Tax=Aquisphaera insulae TaxID=2712864 RepID=UPI00196B324F|nr:alkaline phosphatase [Aquisphaera insulae]
MPAQPHSDRSGAAPRAAFGALSLVAALAAGAGAGAQEPPAPAVKDRIKELQARYVASAAEKLPRAYHFGSQGPGDVFSNHHSHSNRMVPVYTFGRKIDVSSVMGSNSRYRDPERIKETFGRLPENTLNPSADYADQSDLRRVLSDAAGRGVKHLFIVWFDGLDWPTTRAAAIVKSGKVYDEGKGAGLFFQDYAAEGSAQYGYVVTSPTHDFSVQDVDRQMVSIPARSLPGGYDAQIAGPNPWTLGPLGPKAPGYFKGQNSNDADKAGVLDVKRILHAYTDSSQSAAELVSGVKSYNSGLNVADDSRLVPTLFHELQERGWKAGTVTSVPFNHASPAGMYAQNVERDDYQDLARSMLGLPGIIQQARGGKLYPGLDVVMGTGYGIVTTTSSLKMQGKNGVEGPLFITDADRAAIDVRNGGKYVCVHTEPNTSGEAVLKAAAAEAVRKKARLFGLFGAKGLDHLPYRTADGRFDPAPSLNSKGVPVAAEAYSPTEILAQPTLVNMAESAIDVLSADPDRPFILFVEAGDVDFGLHANNLDNAIGALYSGEAAVQAIVKWVEAHSNWDDSAVLVSSDHGHYLVVDDPKALIEGD